MIRIVQECIGNGSTTRIAIVRLKSRALPVVWGTDRRKPLATIKSLSPPAIRLMKTFAICSENWRTTTGLARGWHQPISITSILQKYQNLQRARYALLLPDLTAPHANKALDHAIAWPEALALCVLHQPSRWSNDFYCFATQFEEVPDIDEAKASDNAGWRFAGWYHDLRFTEGDEGQKGFKNLAGLPAELQVAKSVVLAAKAYYERQFVHACQIIDDTIENIGANNIDDVDMAWLLLQKGNSLCELVKKEEAANLYAESCRLIKASKSNQTDLTAKMLHNVAIAASFNLQLPSKEDIGGLISARDSDLARFSLRRDALNFDKLVDERFEKWSPSGCISVGASDTILINSQVSVDIGLLSGNVPTCRGALSNMAMIGLADRGAEGDSAVASLSMLLRAGDANRLGQALDKIKRAYDPKVLISFMEALSPDDVSPITSFAYMKAIQACGEYLSRSQVSKWFTYLINAVDDPDSFAKRYTAPGTYHTWPAEAIRCICSMRYQLTAGELKRAFESILTSKVSLESASSEIQRLTIAFNDNGDHTKEDITIGEDAPKWLASIFDEVSPAKTREERETIHQEILSGGLSS